MMLMPRSRLVWLAAVLLSVAAASGLASAGPGDPDLTFGGGDGRFVLESFVAPNGGMSFSRVAGVAIQTDGRIVVGGEIRGDFGLVRLLRDGSSLDSSFGTNGIVTTDFGVGLSEGIRAIAIQPDDDRIVAVGSSGSSSSGKFAVARYSPDGTLDWKVLTDFPGRGGEATAVALQLVGDTLKIVVAGTAFRGVGTDEDVAVVRLNANDGSPDSTLNGTGKVIVTTPRPEVTAAIAIQPDGKIVVGGYTRDPQMGDQDFFLVRLVDTGGLDSTFGSGGQVTTDFSDLFGSSAVTDDFLGGIAVQADGKIVAGGYTEDWDFLAHTFALARYGINGALEGRVYTRDGAGQALALRPDGKILLGGFADTDQGEDFALAQYGADGVLDATFGAGGVVTTDFSGGSDFIQALALQADQKIVAAGTTDVAGTRLAVARYLGGDTTAPTIRVTPSLLWPPNHQMVPVVVEVTATDDVGPVTCRITEITSNEPVNGPGDGDTAPDWLITGPLSAQLRAERSGGGAGRLYTLTVECEDPSSNAVTTDLLVRVPHSRKN